MYFSRNVSTIKRVNLTTCDILASEQGQSCSWLDQVPSFKVIYVRFIIPEPGKSIPSEMLELDPFQSQPRHKKCGRMLFHTVLYLQSAQRKV